MELSELLLPEAVVCTLRVKSKRRLLQEVAQTASDRFGLENDAVLASLLERESLGPTGVGHGVAIPHGRVEGIDRVGGMFFKLESPVDFDSVDRKPVDLVFLLLAPIDAGAEHLKALARVSRTLRAEEVCAKLRSTADAQAIYAILTAEEASKAA